MTLASWGRFNKVCFQSHALGVIFDDVLGGCPAVHIHLHQFVVQAVGLVETLAEFHQLKVLGPDVLQVRQLGLTQLLQGMRFSQSTYEATSPVGLSRQVLVC